MTNSQQRGKTR